MFIFDIDRWVEIWVTITRNKTRSLLTGFGVFWGILMLVILLGSGNGFKNGVLKNFDELRILLFRTDRRTLQRV